MASVAGKDVRPYPEAAYQNPDSPPGVGINWNLMEANNEGDLAMSGDERAVAFIAGTILERFDLPHSDDEFKEHYDVEDSESENEPEVINVQEPGLSDSGEPRAHKKKCSRTQDARATNRFWFPWPDCIVNNVDDVPSIKQMQKINLALQKFCGIETISYNGTLGNKYFVNNLAQILAQEMANPRGQPHLSFYPEDSGPKLSEACQAMLDSDVGEFCIPIRWFARGEQFWAKCWRMVPVSTEKGSGWRVVKSDDYKVPAHCFLKNVLQFRSDATIYNVPHPSQIIDIVDPDTNKSTKWEYTNPAVGNCWRAKAQGSRVVMFPMWMYCDDTSGNKEYNIHFLCTSNLARPLEMLDGIVDQLEKAQGQGIWVWDVKFNEPVLVIPKVLALLGDNPMQSEFACHIGVHGKLCCRACCVKGHATMDGDDGDEPTRATTAAHSDGRSVCSEGSDTGDNIIFGQYTDPGYSPDIAWILRISGQYLGNIRTPYMGISCKKKIFNPHAYGQSTSSVEKSSSIRGKIRP
ncbi:hypothetical protein B0H14DRAFT_2593756 [Mycena olivaceomarginata]|nr:hypothetical protein B0H14DRAFT_2593756 [Mycena olivaceomarginata]